MRHKHTERKPNQADTAHDIRTVTPFPSHSHFPLLPLLICPFPFSTMVSHHFVIFFAALLLMYVGGVYLFISSGSTHSHSNATPEQTAQLNTNLLFPDFQKHNTRHEERPIPASMLEVIRQTIKVTEPIKATAPWELDILSGQQSRTPLHPNQPLLNILVYHGSLQEQMLKAKMGNTMGELVYWRSVLNGLTKIYCTVRKDS